MSKIDELYDHFDEENRLLRSRESQVEAETTFRFLKPYIKNAKLLEVGCGTGYYATAFKNVYSSYEGIDLSNRNIKVFNATIKRSGIKHATAKIGDALSLDAENESYDVVLVLGPLYHLGKRDRKKAIDEAVRVCKKDGVVAFSYMSKFGNFVKLCAQENFVGMYPNKKLLNNMLTKGTDDDELFYFSSPEEIETILKSCGLKIEHHLTTDGVTMHHHRIADFRDDEFKLWLEFHFATCEEPSVRGMGDHGLVICRKK